MEIISKTTLTSKDIQQLYKLYQDIGWFGHTPENIEVIYNASTHIFVAIHQQKIVGCARALSDGVFNAAIYDVIVHPHYQRQGIGKKLLHQLCDTFRSVSCIHLISTIGHTDFYESCGFKLLKTGMGIYQKENLAETYLYN
ncbi:hypothetical protein RN70_11805 [Staphylococcus schleiferi]|uniref:GNAT family N-acetyltransferase n=1 Tax=Staphylococcus coagulans TaxID=74706 RepID=UPI00067A3445|nr:GNAT family N-acetyltransferase [Staphylococcus coagulans]AKS67951.1 hypothetical protein LH95_11040 [Staphylococcus schleiferi]AKS70114.1 hypothetical protein NP71_11515 [Staphylococcus schleiferi]AKS72234.1 hypothetical protein OA96_10795 [Staphylococcus schleiferi]AKS74521.1 hypothetical protein RN70_11805 [Staphylococcus schleiferi]MBA8765135.1 GNAT family N-acetyltransferase [Staphylococcus coagulans]